MGAYISGGENAGADIEIVTPDNTILHTCHLTPLQATQNLNMYECAVVPPVEVNGGESIVINMRNTSNQVCYRHNGVRETALISVDLGQSIMVCVVCSVCAHGRVGSLQ